MGMTWKVSKNITFDLISLKKMEISSVRYEAANAWVDRCVSIRGLQNHWRHLVSLPKE